MRMRRGSVILVGAAIVAAACTGSGDGIASPTESRVAFVTGEDRAPAQVELCKIGPAGTSATFAITANGGVLPLGVTVVAPAQTEEAFDPEQCLVVWRAVEPRILPEVMTRVSITEVAMSPGTSLSKIFVGTSTGSETLLPPISSVHVDVSFSGGALIKFFNTGAPSGNGSQGCTPGYWKQSQHFDSWTSPFTPSTQFSSVFANAFPGKTLVQVLSAGGGGLTALGRHAVAALLNTASSGVDYGMTTASAVDAFNAAYASGAFETQKNIFEAANENGCPLN